MSKTDDIPQVSFFRHHAKKFHKLNKDDGLSLMQHQNVVAVQCGFKNWDELIKVPAAELQAVIERLRA